MPSKQGLKIFSGSSNPELAHKVCEFLDVPLGAGRTRRFSDGEMYVEVGDRVRGSDVFVIQSTCSPTNEHIMELLIMIDALRRASAKSICAVIPYYGYARQDRKVSPRTAITAKLVCDLLVAAGATRMLCVDLHAGQVQGFLNIPFDHLLALPVMLEHMRRHYDPAESVLVSPDANGVERTRDYAARHGSSLAIIDKRRGGPGTRMQMNIIGEVEGLDAILVDDMTDTGETLVEASRVLQERGARRISAYVTHPVLSGDAIERIDAAPIDKLMVTDTIPLDGGSAVSDKIEVLSTAPLLAKALRRIHLGESVSSLFV